MPSAIDHDLAGYVALVGRHAVNAVLADVEAGNLHALEDLRAAGARALGERLREIGRICLAVAGKPDRAAEIVGAHQRPQLAGFGRRDQMCLDSEAPRCRDHALQEDHALWRARDGDGAALLPAGCAAGLAFELRVELDAVAAHACHRARAAQLSDQPCGMPGRAAGQASLLEEDHV